MRIFLRTIFYQFFLLFVGGAVGFIFNAEYVGWKSAIVEQSIQHIFYPVKYNERIEDIILMFGAARLETHLRGEFNGDLPPGYQILEDAVKGEEFYVARYRYLDENGNTVDKFFQTHMRWKPWEYYYEYHPPTGTPVEELLGEDDLLLLNNEKLDELVPRLEPPKAPGEN